MFKVIGWIVFFFGSFVIMNSNAVPLLPFSFGIGVMGISGFIGIVLGAFVDWTIG